MGKDSLVEKLESIEGKFNELSDLIIQPNIIADRNKYASVSKQYKELEKIIEVYKQYKKEKKNIEQASIILEEEKDEELKEMAREEKNESIDKLETIESQLQYLLIPKNIEDDKDVIFELRAGTGGDEACIFVEDLLRMYTMYFKSLGWSYEIINAQEGSLKGYKEVILEVRGPEAYGNLKFESGVHRVQRVPDTESQGRIHTSAITIAVLAEAQEVDVEINPADIKRDTFRSSGAGGQHVNKTESAIRLTHLPSGIVVECQEERSQHKNHDKAMKVLRSRIYQAQLDKANQQRAQERKSLVSTGDRSAKIRTFNYPQGRITDHRINKSIYNLSNFINGDIQEMIDALKIAEYAQKLKDEEI